MQCGAFGAWTRLCYTPGSPSSILRVPFNPNNPVRGILGAAAGTCRTACVFVSSCLDESDVWMEQTLQNIDVSSLVNGTKRGSLMQAPMTPEQQDKMRTALAHVLLMEGNAACADCGQAEGSRPTWASTTCGVLLCMRCAGVHRSLGVHVSKVRAWAMTSCANVSKVRACGLWDVCACVQGACLWIMGCVCMCLRCVPVGYGDVCACVQAATLSLGVHVPKAHADALKLLAWWLQ